jgi:transcriptional regulator with XRE-family HTH domain
MISSAVEKLRDPEYRKAFVASQINVGVPFQIRALLKARRKTQDWLAKKTGMLQPRISGLMTPGKTHPNIETLRRVADAFECGLAVRFVPFSDLARWSESFDPETFSIPAFDDDIGFIERKAPQSERHEIEIGGTLPLERVASGGANDRFTGSGSQRLPLNALSSVNCGPVLVGPSGLQRQHAG